MTGLRGVWKEKRKQLIILDATDYSEAGVSRLQRTEKRKQVSTLVATGNCERGVVKHQSF